MVPFNKCSLPLFDALLHMLHAQKGGGYGGSGYYPGTNTLGVGSPAYGGGSYGGYGGYGGFGGNGGLQSYYGYNNDNYYGNRNLGYGYYSGTSPSGYVGSTLVSGFRGYN